MQTTLHLEKSNRGGKKKETRKRNNDVNSGHLVPWQRTQATGTKLFSEYFKKAISLNHELSNCLIPFTIYVELWKCSPIKMSIYDLKDHILDIKLDRWFVNFFVMAYISTILTSIFTILKFKVNVQYPSFVYRCNLTQSGLIFLI